MNTRLETNSLTPSSRVDSGSDLWFEAEEDLHHPASASCSDLSQVGEEDDAGWRKDAGGGSTGDLPEAVMAMHERKPRRAKGHVYPSSSKKRDGKWRHSKSLSSLEALRELLSARRAFSPTEDGADQASPLLSWFPRRLHRWDETEQATGDSEDSATEREVEEAFRQAELSKEVPPDEADHYGAIPQAIQDLEAALFTYHRNVKESITELRNRNAPETRGELNLLTSILEEVMDLQTSIAAKKLEGPSLSHAGSMPRTESIASKMVTKYHQKLSKGYYGYGSDADSQSAGSNSELDELLPDLPAFVHDLDTLQDCSCSAAALPELDTSTMEEVLDDCHRHLFHDPPQIDLNLPVRSPSQNSGTVSKETLLEQVGQVLSVVNDERQFLADLFGCSLDVVNLLIQEHKSYQHHMAAMKEDYRLKLRAIEDSMSKQIVSLLRVVEKQEVQLVRQRQQIQQFEDQTKRSDSTHPSSAHHQAVHLTEIKHQQSRGLSTSTPILDTVQETQKQSLASLGRAHSATTEMSAVPLASVDKSPRVFSPTEDTEAQPRWMTRALSWLQQPPPAHNHQKSSSDIEDASPT